MLFRSERDILLLHRQDADGSRTVAAIEKYYRQRSSVDAPDFRRVSSAVHTILDTGHSSSGVAAFVVALNVVAAGRYLELHEITSTGATDLVPTEYYDCDSETGERIKEHIETLVGRLPALVDRLRELSRIELYTTADSVETVEEVLWTLAASVAADAGTVASEQNALQRVLYLAVAVRRYVGVLLDGSVAMANGTGVSVFTEGCFGNEVNRINRLTHRLEKVRYDNPTFTMERYLRIHRGQEQPTTYEREALELIVDFSYQMVQIAHKLARFTGNRRESAGSADTATMPFTPVVFTKPFVAPEVEQLIGGEGPYRGMSILDALTETARYGFLIGRLFEERSIINDLREVSALRAEFDGIIAALRRIASEEVFERVQATWFV